MSSIVHESLGQITGKQYCEEDGSIRISLKFDPQTSRELRDMCDRKEADNVTDAIGRLLGIGFQTVDQFHKGYVEVIFQNPKKRTAHGINLYRNLNPDENQ